MPKGHSGTSSTLVSQHPRNFGLIETSETILSQDAYDRINIKIKESNMDSIFGKDSLRKEYGFFKKMK